MLLPLSTDWAALSQALPIGRSSTLTVLTERHSFNQSFSVAWISQLQLVLDPLAALGAG